MSLGLKGHIGLGEETTWGTGVAPGTFLPGTEDVNLEIARLRIEDPHASRWALPSDKGRVSVRGGTRGHPVYTDAFGKVLKAFFGAPTTTGTGPYTHVFAPPSSGVSGTQALPGISVQVTKGDKTIRYVGGQLNQLTLNAPVDNYLTADLDWIFKSYDSTATAATPTLPTDSIYAFRHLAVQRNAAAFNLVESATFTFTHNLEVETLQDGTDEIAATFLGAFGLQIQLTIAFRDTSLYNDFLSDATGAYTFTWTNGSNSLKIDVPKAVIASYSNPLQGAGRLVATVTLNAEYDSTTGKMVDVTLVNNTATY